MEIEIQKNANAQRTREAVFAQITAMAIDTFEVGVFDSRRAQMMLRTWGRNLLLKSLDWLRYENLRGLNIYIRPAGEHGLSLVDDLKQQDIQVMRRHGFAPAVLVETSPDNFQAWLHHGRTLHRVLSTAVAKGLAVRFHGDQGSADWRHFGRLAGFTNRKEKHRLSDGRFPYVRLIEASGAIYEQAVEFVRKTEHRLKRDSEENELRRKLFAKKSKNPSAALKPIDDFRRHPRYGGAQSRSDLAYAIYALDHGAGESFVRTAIASQDLSFKGSPARQADYLNRILERARGFLEDRGRQR